MNLETEVLIAIFTLLAAVVPWAFSIHAKVATIAASVESLPQIVAEIRQVLQEHEDRLDRHAEEIATIKASARPGH